ncbi:hypothetical protein V3C99_005968 [Haemonchus contortus]
MRFIATDCIWLDLSKCETTANLFMVNKKQFLAQPISTEAQKLTGKSLVEYVNQRQPFFKAEYSPNAKQRMKSLMKMEYLGEHRNRERDEFVMTKEPIFNGTIPESFDSREVWKNCPSIDYIRDQSNCGSCWAVSAASTMSDRICVQSGGKVKKILSDTDIISCCGNACGDGCEGGYHTEAWAYVKRYGVCSGGRFEEPGVCKPYAFHPCGFHKDQKYYGMCPKRLFATPACKKYCQYGYGKRYKRDKVYVKWTYSILNQEDAIQEMLMRKGPVQAIFIVYEDFSYYKNGIYVHTAGQEAGAHAVKLVGWGVENGTKYWTVANSWNTDWGEDGYFRIIRGVNHCRFEEFMVTGDFLL